MRLGLLSTGVLLAGGCLLAGMTPARAAFDANTVPRTTGDLVAICSDSVNAEAASYCNGFVVGTVSTQITNDRARRRGAPLFCLPEQQPDVTKSVADFLGWAKAHPNNMPDPSVDGLLRFVSDTYPCAAPAPRHLTGARRG